MAAKQSKTRGQKPFEHGNLPDEITLSVGMNAMVTINVETDLDIANGSRGQILLIALHKELQQIRSGCVVTLSKPPVFALVKLQSTKSGELPGLGEGVIPITPIERSFTIIDRKEKKTVSRKQLPLTPAYAFTDYRSQGQTIDKAIIDIATPPSGGITAFNIYVALSQSRCRGRDGLRLLRDFDEKLFTTHPSQFLQVEDERLEALDKNTKQMWKKKEEMMEDDK